MILRLLIVLFIVLASAPIFAGVVNPDQPPGPNAVRVVVAEFSGGRIGVAVGQIIGLQIWRTLRRNSYGHDESTGEVVFDRPLQILSYEAAETRGEQRKAAAVVWGEVIVVGDGVIVQAHVSLLDVPGNRVDHRWVFAAPRHGIYSAGPYLAVDCPRRRYDFEPITLDRKLVESVPAIRRLPLFVSARGGKTIGHLGNGNFRALTMSGDAIRVESGKQRAWVRLPQLAQLDNEVAQFTAGIVRFLRKDWHGAIELFDTVKRRSNVPEIVAIDVVLYAAVAKYKSEMQHAFYPEMRLFEWEIEYPVHDALRRNPYLRSSAATLLVLYAAAVHRTDGSARERARLRLQTTVDEYRALFPADDRFLQEMERLSSRARMP